MAIKAAASYGATTRLLLSGFVVLATQFTLSAATIVTLDNPGTQYQQTNDHPCIIGDSSCKNPAGFGFTALSSGGTQNYDALSPAYTVGQIETILGGNIFDVGIDVNSTTHPLATEQLALFTLSVDGVVQFQYGSFTPGTVLADISNGSGFSDDLLKTFDLSGFTAGQSVQFHAIVNNATDGAEEFFLINPRTATPIPEPASLALIGIGLLGIGVAKLRSKRTA
jgi:hypothetical protein